MKHNSVLERFARRATEATGTSFAFIAALAVIVIWAVLGPIFAFSDTWQLVINTSTTIVTFLMVFLIQRAQNKDSLALHLKLNELVAAIEGASARLIDVEDLTEDEIRTLKEHYIRMGQLAKKERSLRESHSIDEAESRHAAKARIAKRPRRLNGVRRASTRRRDRARDPSPDRHR